MELRVGAMMNTNKERRDEQAIELLKLALEEFARDGRVTAVRCDVCGGIIEIKALNDTSYSARCTCGKFRDSLRGI